MRNSEKKSKGQQSSAKIIRATTNPEDKVRINWTEWTKSEDDDRKNKILIKILGENDKDGINKYLSFAAARRISNDSKSGSFSLTSDPRYQQLLAEKNKIRE